MRSLARWGSLLVLAAPLESWALGLGEIEGNSYLNQRLDAEIALTATPQALETLRVAMASPEVFAAEGVEYASVLASIRFEVGRDSAGQPVIHVSSTELVTDPFVTMVVEAHSGRSTIYRVLSVLLDPPTFVAEEVAPEPVAAPVARAPSPAVAGGQIDRQPAAPARQAAPVAPPQARPAAPPAAPASGGSYTVQGGDTLWGITQGVRPAGVSTNQAMLSIYQANPDAFNGNINRLRRGAILRIPPASELGVLGAAAATAEVQRQNDAWQSGVEAEPRLVLLTPGDDAGDAGAVSGAENSARVTELEDEVSDLTAELAATRAELTESRRLLELRDAELANVQSLAEAQAEAVADEPPADAAADEPPADESAVFVDDEPAADEPDVAAAETEDAPARTLPGVTTGASSPSLVEQIISYLTNPIVLGVGAIVALVIVGLAFLRRRREDEDMDDVTGQWEALEAELEQDAGAATVVMPSSTSDYVVTEGPGATQEPSLGSDFESTQVIEPPVYDDSAASGTMEIPEPDLDFSDDDSSAEMDLPLADQTMSSQTVINLDHDDPIAEADFHMAYGLYDQAAELVNKALEDEPGNLEYKLKLLEVYFVWGNRDAFLDRARALRSDIGQGASADWDKVVIMGKQICPDEALFSEAPGAASEVDLDLESSDGPAGLDFAFDDTGESEMDLDLVIDDGSDAAIEPIGAKEARVEASSGDETLDIGEQTQAGLEAALLEDLDDDEYEAPWERAQGSTADASGLYARDDTAEQPRPARPGATTDSTAEIELDDLGLDVGDIDDLSAPIGGASNRATSGDDAGIDFVLDDSASIATGNTLSGTGVTQVLGVEPADDEMSQTGTGVFGEATASTTEVLTQPAAGFEPEPPETEDDLDLNLDDFSSALGGAGDTAEHPVASGYGSVDLDIGDELPDEDESAAGADDYSPLDPQTMTEVGTKLDLARAYIDMGDPEGAKSILEEVLSEGDSGQRTEAQSLINTLTA